MQGNDGQQGCVEDVLREAPDGSGCVVSQQQSASCLVPISSLLPADSPRSKGEDDGHVRLLAESNAVLPPILVHRSTLRVIDGMHRLRAARLLGRTAIEVQFFDGSRDDAFVRAVEANVTHGLPLSLPDRKAAAERILAAHPEWSNRVIAGITGLADTTIGAIRRRPTSGFQQSDTRVGVDGRIRPLSGAAGRLRARDIIAARPEASLREIAEAAGISPETARDVRRRMRRGDDPLPTRMRDAKSQSTISRRRPVTPTGMNLEIALDKLRRDPSLRFSKAGRSLLQWLGVHQIDPDNSKDFLRAIPPHCTATVAELARGCAEKWAQIAEELDEQS